MADEHGLFFNSVDADRVYDADSFAEWLTPFFKNGVFIDSFQPTASGSMTITIGEGIGYINGKLRTFDKSTRLTFEPANGTYPRIDAVVVERNDTDREITMHIVKGAFMGNDPEPPAPKRENGIYQLVLFQVYIPAGATEITAENITDTRPNAEICGYVSNAIESPDFQNWYALNQEKFEEWFANIREQLDTDVAGHLQNQIDTLSSTAGNLQTQVDGINANIADMKTAEDALTETVCEIGETVDGLGEKLSAARIYTSVQEIGLTPPVSIESVLKAMGGKSILMCYSNAEITGMPITSQTIVFVQRDWSTAFIRQSSIWSGTTHVGTSYQFNSVNWKQITS